MVVSLARCQNVKMVPFDVTSGKTDYHCKVKETDLIYSRDRTPGLHLETSPPLYHFTIVFRAMYEGYQP